MSWKSATRIKHRPAGQDGAVSPFMFGLLMGIMVLSVISARLAQKDLVTLQARQAERAKRQAEDTVKALEFSALTETRQTYSEEFTLDRAKANMARATGTTRGGQEYILNAKQDEQGGAFGSTDTKVAVTASDDTLLRAKVYQTGSADGIAKLGDKPNQPVAVLDTGGIRQRQVLTSQRSMEALAEQVYAFYAGHMRFPTSSEFNDLQAKFPYVDAWGGTFDYTPISDEKATLEFTTPWNYTQTMPLSLMGE